ncbi:MAG: hypothetical protein ACOYOS_08025 [Syntrophales bacterium]
MAYNQRSLGGMQKQGNGEIVPPGWIVGATRAEDWQQAPVDGRGQDEKPSGASGVGGGRQDHLAEYE